MAAALGAGPAWAQTFGIPGAGVRFAAPAGFTPLSAAEIGLKFPAAQPPSQAVGNKGRSVCIAYDLRASALRPDQVGQLLASMVATFGRMVPGIAWQQRKLEQLNGVTWALLEFSSNAVDTDIHNMMLVTSHRQRMLAFNFNATKGAFRAHEAALRASIASIELS